MQGNPGRVHTEGCTIVGRSGCQKGAHALGREDGVSPLIPHLNDRQVRKGKEGTRAGKAPTIASGTVDMTIQFGGVDIFANSEDLCQKATCPIQQGPVKITLVEYLPPIAPPVRLHGYMDPSALDQPTERGATPCHPVLSDPCLRPHAPAPFISYYTTLLGDACAGNIWHAPRRTWHSKGGALLPFCGV
eukprot:349785-Chlamydomonas_euryale.AAC.7